MSKDYYKILGVDKNASQDDIKKAFRQKAHQFHPDKAGGDEAKFKEINEAYQVLGDPNKRAQYDKFGSAFENAQPGGGFSGFEGFRDFSGFSNGSNFDFEDLGDIFGGFGDIFGFEGRGGARKKRGNDIQVILSIDFLEAVFGTEKEIKLEKIIECDRCKGSGAEPGSKVKECPTCHGTGRVTKTQRTILGNVQMQTVCPECQGEGKIYDKKCSKCAGRGAVRGSETIKIKVPAGINEGETIRIQGKGEAGQKGNPAGDLYVRINVKPDKRFVRDGYDIKTQAEISFKQAALGSTISIETVDGELKLKIPEGTQSGTVFKLRGKGVPILRKEGKRGDHLVEVKVVTPTHLNRSQKKLLEELDI